MGSAERTVIALSVLALPTLLLTQLLAVWPGVMAATEARPKPSVATMPRTSILFGLWRLRFEPCVALMLMVLLVGAIAVMVALSRRFLYFALRDELTRRDEWAYLLRPGQGAVLALIVYFALRGGFLGQDASSPVNPHAVAAISALVGLFTRHAMSKLSDVFDTAFGKPKEETEPLEADASDGADA